MTDATPSSNQLSQICSCTWVEGLRMPGIDCPVHPRPAPGPDRFRKFEGSIPWALLPCRLCGFPAELWQRWVRDDIWCSFGACSNLEDVDGEACIFHLPDSPHFYRDRKADAVRHWNLMMGPRGDHETKSSLDEEFIDALDRAGVREPLEVYDSNSYRRVGLKGQYRELVYAEAQRSDGHLSIHGTPLLRAMVAAFNAMLARSGQKASADPLDDAGVPVCVNNPSLHSWSTRGHNPLPEQLCENGCGLMWKNRNAENGRSQS